MEEQDIYRLFLQIKNIILNKPISQDLKTNTKELENLQQAIDYLSNCIVESNQFLTNLAAGNLDAQTPSRHNFLSGSLKELHSGLKHLTWQANQVANGDYKQRVGFLGEFSSAFNKMIEQLEERENKLRSRTTALMQSMDLMVSIMDSLQEWIIVTEKSSGDIIYVNQAARVLFDDIDNDIKENTNRDGILAQIIKYSSIGDDNVNFEFDYEYNKKIFHCKSFLIQWNDTIAYVHFITDITSEVGKKEQLENMAFKDELTGLFNRRYCLKILYSMLAKKESFSIGMIDMDGLKPVNDNLGHLEGDEYIKFIGREIVTLARDTDVICRIGGDEFIAILPKCKDGILESKLNQLNEILENSDKEYDMSISYGVVYIDEETKLSVEEILEKADEKMYKFKNLRKKERQS
ncbi:diguanylate cyclase [uncultured Tyzzerella sp.]|uniref:sensor domain-containing diguanylate cyclase n=1 Tax=uncultured Tyzzerella sp. TaxID=2321398 RepID=UPI002942C134|nr:diguanylate cyclase [uncultured Tyzzerella sp.]